MSKNIVILGAGESGTGAAILAKKKGFNVFVSDMGKIRDIYKDKLGQNNIDWEENNHSESKILLADEIIKSPGIPEKADIIKRIRKQKINIISEIEFAARYTKATIIGITGSNGKTTTVNLLVHILKNAGRDVGLAGNVGESFAEQVAEGGHEYFVLEISSFQLDDIVSFKPDVAVILNITPDHLDRYNYSFEDYVMAKMRIIENQNQEDRIIYCYDDPVLKEQMENQNITAGKYSFSVNQKKGQSAYVEENQLIINYSKNIMAMSINELALQGKHNLYNSMAAGIAARVLEIRKGTIRDSLSDFQGIEHRL